jgi:uncharacterized lipoprotein YajG
MITLRRKVIVWVSAIVVTLALVVLPGCSKKETTQKTTTKTEKTEKTEKTPKTPSKTDKAVKDLE